MSRSLVAMLIAGCGVGGVLTAGAQEAIRLSISSTLDGVAQPVLLFPAPSSGPTPLLVLLHRWSAHYDSFDYAGWKQAAAARGWHLLLPEFRGPNFRPEACASPQARRDILDAVDYACTHYAVDAQRIYLGGTSGGAHMAMVMAAYAPERWAGVTAWAGISDLARWHAETQAAGRDYWKNIEKVVGGAPGTSATADAELHYRSPIHALLAASCLPPLDLNTGIHDGHTGSVPVHHTLDAFNALAPKYGAAPVPREIMDSLARELPGPEEEEQDTTYGRRIHLRRHAGPSRVTIFEGGHEDIPAAACAWLSRQRLGD
ncbi:MAG: prolyl oligopeptidase family serine peptidase [Candidatus Hydrogenedentes bacterium]|nr:prolyl oligopeptidase family serine peptidase [Candidatus Hydrogenedentota bacterium]